MPLASAMTATISPTTGLHPKLYWHRTKTLGRGGDCCDFA
ncbi:MAG: L-2-amino-thiazoline-4-carboxylic acid hydrolase [Acutalibacteraceae bacterium]